MKNLITAYILLFLSIQVSKAQDSLKFSKRQVAEDIIYLLKNAEDIHPNLYHSISHTQLINRVDSLVKTLPDSLSELKTYRTLAIATAYINEGHTGVNIPPVLRKQIRAGTFQSIPLQVTDYTNKSFSANIVSNSASNIKNIRVTNINGQSAESIFKQIISLKGGLVSFRKVSAINYFRFYITIIGITQPYNIEYLDSKNIKRTIKVNNISESEYLASIVKSREIKPYEFNIKNNQYGYLNFKSMDNYNSFIKFCDSVFNVLYVKSISKLVVDLRENGGGNSSLGKYLLNYITDKPYRMAGESGRKVSQQFKDQIERNKKLYGNNYDAYLKTQNGTFLNMGLNDLDKPSNISHKFKGKTCFLIGPYTFSSANMLAATIKDYKLATLIGEPTGEPGNDYGELCDIKLPKTNFIAFTSTTVWVRPNNDKTDKSPIVPDYIVKKSSFANDAVLQYAIDWLK